MDRMRELVITLVDLTAAMNLASKQQEQLLVVVTEWVKESEDEALTSGVRETYMQCAEDVIKIFAESKEA